MFPAFGRHQVLEFIRTIARVLSPHRSHIDVLLTALAPDMLAFWKRADDEIRRIVLFTVDKHALITP